MNTDLMFSQNTDVWSTPQWLFDALDKEFGFTLDPCSDGANNKCVKFYTGQENGLLRDWGTETVFMNPPYSECEAWMHKAYSAAQGGGNRGLSGAEQDRHQLVAPICNEGRGAAVARSVEIWNRQGQCTIPKCRHSFQAKRIQAGGL